MRIVIGIIAAICAAIGYAQYHRHQLQDEERARVAAERENTRRLDSIIQVDAARAAMQARADSIRAAFANQVHDRRMELPPAREPSPAESRGFSNRRATRPAGPP